MNTKTTDAEPREKPEFVCQACGLELLGEEITDPGYCPKCCNKALNRIPLPDAGMGTAECQNCHGKGWIFKGHGNDEQCDCIFVEPPEDAPCTSCGKPRSVLRKSLNDHLCNACRAQESE